jgi:trans-aconitate 2-methyltransferase
MPRPASAFSPLTGERLAEAYPPGADGQTLFPFRRIFFVAQR